MGKASFEDVCNGRLQIDSIHQALLVSGLNCFNTSATEADQAIPAATNTECQHHQVTAILAEHWQLFRFNPEPLRQAGGRDTQENQLGAELVNAYLVDPVWKMRLGSRPSPLFLFPC
jgi:hypothetical protein